MKLIALLACALTCACTSSGTTADAGVDAAPLAHVVRPTPPALPAPSLPPPEAPPEMSVFKDSRTPTQIATAGCWNIDKTWRCSTPKPKTFAATGTAPIITPSWTVPNWFVDPANSTGCALDTNSCTSATCAGGSGPCATVAEVFVHRLGWTGAATGAVNFQQPTLLTMLSDQLAPWTDPVNVGDFYTSTNAAGTVCTANLFAINGTLIQQTTATIGTFTPRNRATAQFNEITASGQSGSYWTPYVGMLVNDTTAGAWFWVDADLGSATALITEPFSSDQIVPTVASPFNTYTTIANSDALVVYRGTRINMQSVISNMCQPVLQHLQFTHSNFYWAVSEASGHLVESAFDQNCIFTTGNNGGIVNTVFFYNSFLGSQVSLQTGYFYAGALNPHPAQCAGLNGGAGSGGAEPFVFDGDVVIDDNSAGADVLNPCSVGNVRINRAGLRTVWDENPGSTVGGTIRISNTGWAGNAGYLWGPYGLTNEGPSQVFVENVVGNTATSMMLLLGTGNPSGFSMDGTYTGYTWDSGSRTYGPAITINGPHLDDAGVLLHPGFAGSRYSLQFGTSP